MSLGTKKRPMLGLRWRGTGGSIRGLATMYPSNHLVRSASRYHSLSSESSRLACSGNSSWMAVGVGHNQARSARNHRRIFMARLLEEVGENDRIDLLVLHVENLSFSHLNGMIELIVATTADIENVRLEHRENSSMLNPILPQPTGDDVVLGLLVRTVRSVALMALRASFHWSPPLMSKSVYLNPTLQSCAQLELCVHNSCVIEYSERNRHMPHLHTS